MGHFTIKRPVDTTSVDARYLAIRNADQIAYLNGRRLAKRRRRRIMAWLRGWR